MKKPIKPVVVKAPKRRNIVALHAKMRKAGPMADTSRHAYCTECGDSGVVYDGRYAVPCYECQSIDIDPKAT